MRTPVHPDRRVVICQPMLFPWVGQFEQVRLADEYVHLDDVQLARGFMNRVQVKTMGSDPMGPGPTGSDPKAWRWLTVPLAGHRRRQRLCEIALDEGQDWRRRHLALLSEAYRGAPFRQAMLELVESVYAGPHRTLAALTIASMEASCALLEIAPGTGRFRRASALNVPGSSWPRLLAIVQRLGGRIYVTGHGARNYLDHEAFEAAGVRVHYMDYERRSYPQLHGSFDPHVSVLDLIANMGRDGREVIASRAVDWRRMHELV